MTILCQEATKPNFQKIHRKGFFGTPQGKAVIGIIFWNQRITASHWVILRMEETKENALRYENRFKRTQVTIQGHMNSHVS